MLITQVAVLLEFPSDDVLQFRGNLAVQAHYLHRILVQNTVEDRSRAVPPVRKESGSHFVQRDAKGKQVRARVQSLAEYLLRRHIGNRSKGSARAGQVLRVRSRRSQ